MARRDLDLAAVAAIAVAGWLGAVESRSSLLGAVPGSLLVLVAPGYALSVALLPARTLDRFERAALTLGLSVSLTIVGAVVLDAAGVRLTPRSIAPGLAAMALLSAAAGVARRRRADRLGGPTPPPGTSTAPWPRLTSICLGCVALALVAAAVAVARLPAVNVEGYTILWALPASGGRDGFSVGVQSEELGTTTYLLTAVSGRTTILRRRITLPPGGSWRTTATVAKPGPTGEVVDVSLARVDRPGTVYRQVHLDFGAVGV